MIDVIYLTAGHGQRVELGYPKQYYNLGGKPILIHGLEVLRSVKEIGKIRIVTNNLFKTTSILSSYNIGRWEAINGGATRQESVSRGLRHIESEFVLIAEGVRPFINRKFIKSIVDTNADVVIPYMKSTSTVFNKDNGNTFDRNSIVQVQTPQKYKTEVLKSAHKRAQEIGISNSTDDLYLIKNTIIENSINVSNIKFILGPIENIKITYPIDLSIAEAIYNYRNKEKID